MAASPRRTASFLINPQKKKNERNGEAAVGVGGLGPGARTERSLHRGLNCRDLD